jgi:hypothetical protein
MKYRVLHYGTFIFRARKKLSETFGTSYDDIDLTQEIPSSSQASTSSLKCDENSNDLESLHDESGSISDVSMDSSDTSSDSNSNSSESKDSRSKKSMPTTPVEKTTKCDVDVAPRKILPAGGNPVLNLPMITVHVMHQAPPLASEAETSTAQQVVQNPIPEAVQPIQAYMQAADADPPIAPVLQAVMPAAEAAQPQVPNVEVASGLEKSQQNVNVPVPVSDSSHRNVQEPKIIGIPLRLNSSDSNQSILTSSPARSNPGSATKSECTQTPTPRTPPAFSSPSMSSSPTVILTPGSPSIAGFITPKKKYPLIAPKASTSKESNVSPFIEKVELKYRGRSNTKIKRRLVNRPIQPKGIIISPTKSPTKKAADSIKARLRRKPRPIFPKLPQMRAIPESRNTMVTPPPDGFSDEDYGSDEEGENEPVSSPVADEPSDFLDSENDDNVGDSQGEEEAEDGHLAELMAASTTIRYSRIVLQ